ncbi:MAG TPA: UDP-2,3-diacylglucosamine diphosphatase [Noviherbaspirillum sp.]|jgi:UDP-2,3-diacylglucosamine hydrolase|uniref:UDP-2,3-diacylglucosamine diphosphatase n=1 Tax=Noviherbaspirillum sp. TaxID=1926288 RepID=UPI002F9489BC
MPANEMPAAAGGDAQPDPVALFVSDVHLQPALPRTTQAFLDFLRKHACRAQRLYLLGDLFEYWAGDDDIEDPYNLAVVAALREVSDAGVQLYWIPGNRDFLVGEAFAGAAGLQLLSEPHVLQLAGRKLVLVHGDAQCTDDTGYMAFRAQVRQPGWQAAFLAKSLAERKAIIAGMRSGSREAQREKSYAIMDVNQEAIEDLFAASGAEAMIHGHTHRPAVHRHPAPQGERERHVLPDWDCDATPARGGWLALQYDGTFRHVPVETAAS